MESLPDATENSDGNCPITYSIDPIGFVDFYDYTMSIDINSAISGDAGSTPVVLTATNSGGVTASATVCNIIVQD